MDLANLRVKIGADTRELSAGIGKAEREIKNFAATASAGTNKAKTDFTNLGRVVQDLPFGFTAISNNLTQLIPGVGALGLAFSGLVAAITFAQMGFGAWTRGLGGASEAAKKAKKETEEFAESLKSAEANALSTGVQLQNFVSVARNGQLPLEQRNYALREANKILGEHGDKLTLANVGTEKATELIQKYTDALVQQALATKYADRIAELLIKQREASEGYGKALQFANKAQKQLESTVRTTREKELGLGEQVVIQRDKANRELVDAAGLYRQITTEIYGLQRAFSEASSKSVGLFGEIGIKPKELKVKPAKVDIDVPDYVSLRSKGIKFVWTEGTGSIANRGELRKQIEKMLTDEVGGNIRKFEIPFSVTGALDNLDKIRTKLAAIGEAITNTFAQPLQQAFQNILEGQNAIQSLGNMIRQLVVRLVAAAAAAAVLAGILSAVGLGGGKGFMFAFKGIFSSLAGLPKFAKGGMVTGPTLAMVGDNPSGKEAIIPFEKMGEFISGLTGGRQQMVFIPEVRWRGSDIYMGFKRAEEQYGRNY